MQCPERFKKDPSLCEWDNPFVVRAFPHIHHYLTAMFTRGQGTFDDWAREGFTLHRPSDGKPHEFMWTASSSTSSVARALLLERAKMSDNPPPGTVLILAGHTGVGKSFFATELLGRLMGGWDYADKMYLEGSRFNSETVKKPVHVIDDKLGSKTHRDRLKFTEALKVVSRTDASAARRSSARRSRAFRGPAASSFLSNVDSQSLSVLPDLACRRGTSSRCSALGGAKYSFGTTEENQKWLAEELPAFARFLLGLEDPGRDPDERFGVKAVQHSDMAQASAENGLTQIPRGRPRLLHRGDHGGQGRQAERGRRAGLDRRGPGRQDLQVDQDRGRLARPRSGGREDAPPEPAHAHKKRGYKHRVRRAHCTAGPSRTSSANRSKFVLDFTS